MYKDIIDTIGYVEKAVDQAAAKGLLHKKNADNKKSSMTIKLNKLA